MEWPLLNCLNAADREQVVRIARRRVFGRGEVIVREGDTGDALHLIASGRAAAYVATEDGDRATLRIMSPGDFFGELSLVRPGDDRHRTATVIALERCETRSLPASTFLALCDRNPEARRLLVEILAARVEQLTGHLLEALYVRLDHRVCRCLLELRDLYATDQQGAIPLTQTAIADLVGGTRASVNQILQRLARDHVVELGRGRVTVLDEGALRREARLP